jgi:hypothetical protein
VSAEPKRFEQLRMEAATVRTRAGLTNETGMAYEIAHHHFFGLTRSHPCRLPFPMCSPCWK